MKKHEDMDEKELVKLEITGRIRDPKLYIECESGFDKHFRLVNEFNSKYKYFMEGKARDIQRQLESIKVRLDEYI